MVDTVHNTTKRRASAPRVRTGCKTCKIRRLKCDERKPSCERCIKFGVTCDGYNFDHKKAKKTAEARSLVPKGFFPLERSPSSNLFDLDKPEEWTYFQRFCSYTVGRLSSKVRNSDFWGRIVLQETQLEPSIRYAATAIGALDLKPAGTAGEEEERKMRKQFAYKEYQKAIVGLRKTLEKENCDVRTRLIACILFACFEAYHGNSEAALVQIYAGTEMLHEHLQKKIKTSPFADSRIKEADYELMASFTALEIQSSAWGDRRSVALHTERMYQYGAIVDNGIPHVFESIRYAVYTLMANTLRGNHIVLSQVNAAVRGGPCMNVPLFAAPRGCVDEIAIKELERCLVAFKQWGVAYEPLYRKAISPERQHMFEAATILRTLYLGGMCWVATSSPRIECYYRKYTNELREIISTVRILIETMDNQTFGLDVRIVLPLAVVGLNYRHRALRQECIDIMWSMERREVVWDAAMIARIMKFQAEIEEEGLNDEEEYVPEDGMSTIFNLEIDETAKSALLVCSLAIRGSPGETVLKETRIFW